MSLQAGLRVFSWHLGRGEGEVNVLRQSMHAPKMFPGESHGVEHTCHYQVLKYMTTNPMHFDKIHENGEIEV